MEKEFAGKRNQSCLESYLQVATVKDLDPAATTSHGYLISLWEALRRYHGYVQSKLVDL